mgnify:CR=1 FL=1|tara:strand:- start:771 stop:1160 length:390 start_codon:yes stop_codon:yes gene_type:complete
MAQEISIKGLLQDLKKGLTRTKASGGYDSEVGSIEEKYELSAADVKRMFKHPLLANRKTIPVAKEAFILIDDVTPVPVQETTPTPAVAEVSSPSEEGVIRAETPSHADSAAEVPVNLTSTSTTTSGVDF